MRLYKIVWIMFSDDISNKERDLLVSVRDDIRSVLSKVGNIKTYGNNERLKKYLFNTINSLEESELWLLKSLDVINDIIVKKCDDNGWEYNYVSFYYIDKDEILNPLKDEGWEVIKWQDGGYCDKDYVELRRRKPDYVAVEKSKVYI